MSEQDTYVLNQIVQQEHQKAAPKLSPDKFFELFVANQVVKAYGFDFDDDQIQSGIVGNGGDGGLDALYLVVNRQLVRDDTDIGAFANQPVSITLLMIQAKNKISIPERAINNFGDVTGNCLKINDQAEQTEKLYKSSITECFKTFREVYQNSLSQRPNLEIYLCYASYGEQIDSKVEQRRVRLERTLSDLYSTASVSCQIVKPKQLLEWFNKPVEQVIPLKIECSIPWAEFGESYVCLVLSCKSLLFCAMLGHAPHSRPDHPDRRRTQDSGTVGPPPQDRAAARPTRAHHPAGRRRPAQR